MTSPDPRILDLTAFDRPAERQHRSDPGDLHMLRLALDLQLDALLLTLGASAQVEGRGPVGVNVPWQRWLVEDLELARTLAATLVDGDAPPVPALGGGFAHVNLELSLDNLAARYESMESLLVRVLDRPMDHQPWRSAAGEALQRCRQRISELHEHRRDAIATSAATRVTSHPGEWLG